MFTRARDASTIRATDVNLLTTLPLSTSDVAVNTAYKTLELSENNNTNNDDKDFLTFTSGPEKIGSLKLLRLTELDDPVGDWALKITLSNTAKVDFSTKMWMIVRYREGNNG